MVGRVTPCAPVLVDGYPYGNLRQLLFGVELMVGERGLVRWDSWSLLLFVFCSTFISVLFLLGCLSFLGWNCAVQIVRNGPNFNRTICSKRARL